MAAVRASKVVVVCFLEATKQTLEHIAVYRLQDSRRLAQGNEVARLYGATRRLRDYLQRCASTPQELLDLDLSAADQCLLVACCRRAVDIIDQRLSGNTVVPAEEKQWLQEKRQLLADQAVRLAQKPLLELPLPRVTPTSPEGGRALLARLQDKLFGEVASRPKIVAPSSGVGDAPKSGIVGSSHGISLVPDPSPADAALPDENDDPAASSRDRSAAGQPGRAEPPPLLLSQQLKDHRLRALVITDLITLGRAREAKDFRIATVLLASVLEAAVVDHSLARRCELSLTGTPDTWDPRMLLVRIIGDSPKDRSLAHQLFASRNLLRPALLITAPVVVTPASFAQFYEFAQRALHAMGFATGSTQSVALQAMGPPAAETTPGS